MNSYLHSQLLLTVLFLGTIGSLAAQDTTATRTRYRFGLGAGAGFATGYGLSFRYQPTALGIQLNFAPYKDATSSRYSIGLTALYTLITSQVTRLYVYQANHFYYHSQTTDVYDPLYPSRQERTTTTEAYVNNGIGFGMEIMMAKRFGLNLMTGYASYHNGEQLNVTGEVALYYTF